MTNHEQPSVGSQKWECAAAIVICAPAVLIELSTGPGITFSRHVPYSSAAPFLLMGFGVTLLAFAALTANERKWKAFGTTVGCLILLFALVRWLPHDGRFAICIFLRERAEFEAAASWILTSQAPARTIQLPNPHANHTYQGEASYFESESGKFVFFPLSLNGIDNEQGIMWSPSDSAPPERARHQIIRIEKIEPGWYVYWTT